MIGPSKILTVSYGTFSCTLEGFDDPFSTMRAIAEYFRDLAAEDRYFGAEPPTPDAEMLHRIAEREIQRRVEAKVEENGIVLRPRREPEQAEQPGPEAKTAGATPARADPVLREAGEGGDISAKLRRIRAAVAQAQGADSAGEGAEEETRAPAPARSAAGDIAPSGSAQARKPADEPAGEPAASVGRAAPEAQQHPQEAPAAAPEEEHAAVASPEPSRPWAEMPDDDEPAASAGTGGDSAPDPARSWADGAGDVAVPPPSEAGEWAAPAGPSLQSPATETTQEDGSYSGGDIAGTWMDVAATGWPAAPQETHDEGDAGPSPSTVDEAGMIEALGADAYAPPDDTTEGAAAPAAEAGGGTSPEETGAQPGHDDAAEDAAAAAPAAGEVEDEDDEPPLAEAPRRAAPAGLGAAMERMRSRRESDAASAHAQWAVTGDQSPAGDDIAAAPSGEGAADEAAAADSGPQDHGDSSEEAAEGPAIPPTASEITDGSEEGAEESDDAIRARVSAALGDTGLPAEAEAELVEELAGVERDAARERRAMRERYGLLRPGDEEESLSRLLHQTNTEMEGAESRQRRSTISHLKAAVAAWRAEEAVQGGQRDSGDEVARYRADLEQAVQPPRPAAQARDGAKDRTAEEERPVPRPRRPQVNRDRDRPRTARPGRGDHGAPLVLVSEQRVDRPGGQQPAGDNEVIRPRRVSRGNLALDAEPEDESAYRIPESLTQSAPAAPDTPPQAAPAAAPEPSAPETGTAGGADASAPSAAEEGSLSAFVEELGVTDLQGLMEATAAWTTHVEGREQFSRPQIMRRLGDLAAYQRHSREAEMRTFGILLRQGSIRKVRRGLFEISPEARFADAARLFAHEQGRG